MLRQTFESDPRSSRRAIHLRGTVVSVRIALAIFHLSEKAERGQDLRFEYHLAPIAKCL
jgi:hypothetical protein